MTIEQLEKLATDLDNQARAVRTTIAILQARDTRAAAVRLPATIAAASRIRAIATGQPIQENRGRYGGDKMRAAMAMIESIWRAEGSTKTMAVQLAMKDAGMPVSNAHVQKAFGRLRGRMKNRPVPFTWYPPRGFDTTPAADDAVPAARAHTNGSGRPPTRTATGRGAPSKARIDLDLARRRMVDLVAQFDRKIPRTLDDVRAALVATGRPDDQIQTMLRGLAPMTRRGYLRKRHGGYVSTAKPYQPTLIDASPE